MAGVFTPQDVDNGLKDKVTQPPPADIKKVENHQGICDSKVHEDGESFQIGENAFSTSSINWYPCQWGYSSVIGACKTYCVTWGQRLHSAHSATVNKAMN